jgi:hypothetical protein
MNVSFPISITVLGAMGMELNNIEKVSATERRDDMMAAP